MDFSVMILEDWISELGIPDHMNPSLPEQKEGGKEGRSTYNLIGIRMRDVKRCIKHPPP